MSWLNANEVFLMEVVSRERVEDLRLAIDLAKESAEGDDEPRGEMHAGRDCTWRRLSAAARA
jgi:hypothetical protein